MGAPPLLTLVLEERRGSTSPSVPDRPIVVGELARLGCQWPGGLGVEMLLTERDKSTHPRGVSHSEIDRGRERDIAGPTPTPTATAHTGAMGRPLATIPAQLRFGSLSLIADEVYAARGVAQVPQTAMPRSSQITMGIDRRAQSFLGVSQLLALTHPPLVPRSSSLPSAHRALSSTLPPCMCCPVCFSLIRWWATHAKQQATSAPTSSKTCRWAEGPV